MTITEYRDQIWKLIFCVGKDCKVTDAITWMKKRGVLLNAKF